MGNYFLKENFSGDIRVRTELNWRVRGNYLTLNGKNNIYQREVLLVVIGQTQEKKKN